MADKVSKDKQSKLDSFVSQTPKASNKRDQPLINGIIESINSWFLRVAQTTSDRCRMVSLWTAVERAWSVLTVLEVTDSLIKGEPKAESLA
jgi:hypothetical protein